MRRIQGVNGVNEKKTHGCGPKQRIAHSVYGEWYVVLEVDEDCLTLGGYE